MIVLCLASFSFSSEAVTEISFCGTYTADNTVYILKKDIKNWNGSLENICLKFMGQNQTFKGNGHTVDADTSTFNQTDVSIGLSIRGNDSKNYNANFKEFNSNILVKGSGNYLEHVNPISGGSSDLVIQGDDNQIVNVNMSQAEESVPVIGDNNTIRDTNFSGLDVDVRNGSRTRLIHLVGLKHVGIQQGNIEDLKINSVKIRSSIYVQDNVNSVDGLNIVDAHISSLKFDDRVNNLIVDNTTVYQKSFLNITNSEIKNSQFLDKLIINGDQALKTNIAGNIKFTDVVVNFKDLKEFKSSSNSPKDDKQRLEKVTFFVLILQDLIINNLSNLPVDLVLLPVSIDNLNCLI